MQAAGELVVLIGEFPRAGGKESAQLPEPLFRVDIHRHSAAIIDNFQRLIGMENDLHAFRVTGQGLIHAVINNFLTKMIWTVVSVYIPGRRRTGSSPVSTSMASALYEDCVMVYS